MSSSNSLIKYLHNLPVPIQKTNKKRKRKKRPQVRLKAKKGLKTAIVLKCECVFKKYNQTAPNWLLDVRQKCITGSRGTLVMTSWIDFLLSRRVYESSLCADALDWRDRETSRTRRERGMDEDEQNEAETVACAAGENRDTPFSRSFIAPLLSLSFIVPSLSLGFVELSLSPLCVCVCV